MAAKGRGLPQSSWGLGIPDGEFFQRHPRKGLITKMEVRVIALAKLGLREDSVVWDIGAGSGSISIEAAMAARRGWVFAIEHNAADVQNIVRNVEKFGTANVQIVPTLAPQGLETLPDPDAIFIGGSGGRLKAILEAASQRLRPGGRLVMNAASVENLSTTLAFLKTLGWPGEVTMVAVARSQSTGELTRFESLNPVFILSAQQPEAREG